MNERLNEWMNGWMRGTKILINHHFPTRMWRNIICHRIIYDWFVSDVENVKFANVIKTIKHCDPVCNGSNDGWANASTRVQQFIRARRLQSTTRIRWTKVMAVSNGCKNKKRKPNSGPPDKWMPMKTVWIFSVFTCRRVTRVKRRKEIGKCHFTEKKIYIFSCSLARARSLFVYFSVTFASHTILRSQENSWKWLACVHCTHTHTSHICKLETDTNLFV